ncbi:atherin-like isoform X1 [Sorghum bicolor]|uniref:atherin-like isoform X1 n=1 Tax=Sorghum bicolor TaxID=4558 RepID=UPI000B424DD2|nr:atherin-like isoform X1 [Sorghum bicolor]|eukprot:XP_021308481.1 atherin-like isoform X1 [Sorghum bicolor]
MARHNVHTLGLGVRLTGRQGREGAEVGRRPPGGSRRGGGVAREIRRAKVTRLAYATQATRQFRILRKPHLKPTAPLSVLLDAPTPPPAAALCSSPSPLPVSPGPNRNGQAEVSSRSPPGHGPPRALPFARAGGSAEGAGAACAAAQRRAARGAPRRPPAAGGDGVHDHGLRAPHGQHQHPRRHGPDACRPLLAADALIGSSAPPATTVLLRVYILLLFGIGREKGEARRGGDRIGSEEAVLLP